MTPERAIEIMQAISPDQYVSIEVAIRRYHVPGSKTTMAYRCYASDRGHTKECKTITEALRELKALPKRGDNA